jgi:cytochrome c oxidase subunit 2
MDSIVQASTYAASVDGAIGLIYLIVGFWFFLTMGIFLWLIVSNRAKPGQKAEYLTGDETQPKKFITYSHYLVLVCDVFIVWAAIQVWVDIKQTLPDAPETQTVRVVSQQWAWSFVHPGPDGVLDTADDIKTVDELHIELDRPYIYELTSRDVLHDFSVPAFRLKQDSIPGRVITGWFQATVAGTHEIQCAEMCGIGHGLMPGKVIVETPEEHAAWMAQKSGSAMLASASR